MSDPSQTSSDKAARKIIDSTVALAFARFVMPIVLAITGWLMISTITDIKDEIRDGNAAVWMAVKEVQSSVNRQAVDIAGLEQSKSESTKAIDRLTAIVDKLNSKP